jgi:hypothetical protein
MALAYFYLVRALGDVPIVTQTPTTWPPASTSHAVASAEGRCNEYFIMTFEKAMEAAAPHQEHHGRIDYYCAEGRLPSLSTPGRPVHLSGTLSQSDLQKAAEYSQDVIDNSGRTLMATYSDIFRGSNNVSDESLFAWRWTVGAHWTSQNTLQSDLAPVGFDENGDCWGGYGGPSLDLIEAFGVSPKDEPSKRIDKDARRQATGMLAGDVYDYFWRDHDLGNGKKGLSYLRFWYDTSYNTAATGECQAPCGGTNVKLLYGEQRRDHIAEMASPRTHGQCLGHAYPALVRCLPGECRSPCAARRRNHHQCPGPGTLQRRAPARRAL